MVDREWDGLQVAAKLFTSHSKLFKDRQLCFSGRTQWVGEEGGVDMEGGGGTRTNCH